MIDLESLRSISSAADAEISSIRSRLETQLPAFVFDERYLAILAFGGTIQSAYNPDAENIIPVSMNPALERVMELEDRFGVARGEVTGAILIARDSRKIENADVTFLIHTIEQMPNKKIVITCGSRMLTEIAQAIDNHFGSGKSDKIIGITGSELPNSQSGQDVDFNIGGAIAAVNVLEKTGQKGIVFVPFHGETFFGDDIAKIDLHPPNKLPRFARPFVDVR